MQVEGLGKRDCLELYFETKHNCTGKRTMGSLARAGLEVRPGSSLRPWCGQGAYSGLLPSGRTDTFLSVESLLTQPSPGYQAGSAHAQKGAMLMAF